jgi:hypothetical protein
VRLEVVEVNNNQSPAIKVCNFHHRNQVDEVPGKATNDISGNIAVSAKSIELCEVPD